MTLTAGIDVGASAVKTAIVAFDGAAPRALAQVTERIRKRELRAVVMGSFERALARAGVAAADVAYVAATGAAEMVEFRRGQFYGMTSHARGATFLRADTRTVLDVGALHARAIRVDARARVLAYRMTGQCASGTGQFIENIARYLGVPIAEVGERSLRARAPELPSGICAVLAETDVINMVSRGVTPEDILKGIHVSVANRLVRLLASIQAESPVLMTGGLAHDKGLLQAVRDQADASGLALTVGAHEHSVLAGALGAALWGEWRLRKLAA
jgi:benzoyl-CoA reductase subunit D